MDFDVYMRRLGNTSSASGALVNATKRQMQSMFQESPLFQYILVEDEYYKGVRVSFKEEFKRQLLLEPDDTIQKGAIVEFNDSKWLVTEFKNDIIYPKAMVSLCNQVLKWKNQLGTIYEYPVVAMGKGYKLNETKEEVKLIDGFVTVQIKYDSITKDIIESQRFIIGDRAYEVSGIDNITNVINGTGYLEITLEIASKASSDDIENKISNKTSNWGGGW